jgi:hypothetical protein
LRHKAPRCCCLATPSTTGAYQRPPAQRTPRGAWFTNDTERAEPTRPTLTRLGENHQATGRGR